MLKNIFKNNQNYLKFNKLQNKYLYQITEIPSIPIFQKALENKERTGIINANQDHFSNEILLKNSFSLANKLEKLLQQNNKNHNQSRKISVLIPPGENFVYSFYATWMLNHCVVPLHYTFPLAEIEYRVKDSYSEILLISKNQFQQLAIEKQELENLQNNENNLKIVYVEDILNENSDQHQEILLKNYNEESDALIIYTSGTTGKPKGAVHTHYGLNRQYQMLIDSWKWTNQDKFLNVLPLHHIHGLVVGFLTCQAAGACTQFMQFNAENVWNIFNKQNISVFMAVPTIYVKLIEFYKKQNLENQKLFTQNVQKLRLMVSGSAALPPEIFQEFYEITGQKILERFGMTEIGMAITNNYENENDRKIGSVGKPFPNIIAKILNTETKEECNVNEQGDLLIKTPSIFKEYLNLPEKTQSEFTKDGFFITGDTAVKDDQGFYYIKGRTSVDIIKSSGYKISALEIENILLKNPEIKEVAIVGIEDKTYGQIIGAMIVKNNNNISDDEFKENLKNWSKKQMSSYKIPKIIKFVSEIPKNAMQKVNKKELVKLYF